MKANYYFSIIGLVSALCLNGASVAEASDITPAGQRLAVSLNALHVDQHWLAGKPVDWRSGDPNGKAFSSVKGHTHCSAFAAAAAERMGIYLLHPPQHSSVLLANAQEDWLKGDGARQGWRPIESPVKAQELANHGLFVVVVFKSHEAKAPGHIAVLRPSAKQDSKILEEGPEIMQAGASNYPDTNVKEGFKHHRGAFETHELLYFAHEIPTAATTEASASSE